MKSAFFEDKNPAVIKVATGSGRSESPFQHVNKSDRGLLLSGSGG